MTHSVLSEQQVVQKKQQTTYKILIIMGLCHLLNDSIQSVIPAMFPILGKSMGLSFTQLGFIAFALNMVSSVMQPFIGAFSDKRPMPYALPIGMTSTLLGVIGLALAPNYSLVIVSVLFIGLGSAIFHPEGSRVAHMAAGTRRGLAQSIYQVGGNSGQALAPLITALILVPLGQIGAAWFSLVAATAVFLLIYIAFWYSNRLKEASILNTHYRSNVADTFSTNLKKGSFRSYSYFVFNFCPLMVCRWDYKFLCIFYNGTL